MRGVVFASGYSNDMNAMVRLFAGGGAVGEERMGIVYVAATLGCHERCYAFVVTAIDVKDGVTQVEKAAHSFEVSRSHRYHERRRVEHRRERRSVEGVGRVTDG